MPIKYARLYALGKERVTVINNKLALGESMYAVARMIQGDWKEFQDVAEKTLVMQLNRYKAEVVTAQSHETKDPDIMVVTAEITKVNVVLRLGELEVLLRERIKRAIDKEKGLGGLLMSQLSKEVTEYRQLLLDIQKVQFDLGLDEYKGPLLQGVRTGTSTMTLPDGTVVKNQVVEAVQMAQLAIARLTEVKVDDGSNSN